MVAGSLYNQRIMHFPRSIGTFKDLFLILSMHVCLSVVCACAYEELLEAWRGCDNPERPVELQVVVIHLILVLGTELRSSGRSVQALPC